MYQSRLAIERRNEAIQWAQSVMDNKDQYVIVDTETTGLGYDDVIVDFAAMDLDGNFLVTTSVKPTTKKTMPAKAKEVHRITMKSLKHSPSFEWVLAQFDEYKNRTILSFRAEFHQRMIEQTFEIDGISEPDVRLFRYECVQEKYQDFLNRSYLSLPGRNNTGFGDCMATLDLIQKMAKAEIMPLPEEAPAPVYQPKPLPQGKPQSKTSCCVWILIALAFFIFVGLMANALKSVTG